MSLCCASNQVIVAFVDQNCLERVKTSWRPWMRKMVRNATNAQLKQALQQSGINMQCKEGHLLTRPCLPRWKNTQADDTNCRTRTVSFQQTHLSRKSHANDRRDASREERPPRPRRHHATITQRTDPRASKTKRKKEKRKEKKACKSAFTQARGSWRPS